jgi:release factor glutamine methyltransferase
MKSSTKRIYYRDLVFEIPPQVYEPDEDSFLAADNLDIKESDDVLDMGTGCGMLAVAAAKTARRVVAIDINPHAVDCTKQNADINNLTHKIEVRRGDLFRTVHSNEKFSLIIFNAPYLPSEPKEDRSWIGKSWAGGPTGRQLIDRFIKEAPKYLRGNGRILLVQSTLANIDETLRKLREEGLHSQIAAEKKVAFETIVLIQASHLFHKPVRKPR